MPMFMLAMQRLRPQTVTGNLLHVRTLRTRLLLSKTDTVHLSRRESMRLRSVLSETLAVPLLPTGSTELALAKRNQ
jgi:hypothetical protein